MAELTRPLRSSFRSAEKTGGRRYSFQLMPAASAWNEAGSGAKPANEEASIGAHSPGVEPECIDPKSDFTKGLGMSFLCALIGPDRSLPTLHVRLLKASPAICFAAIAPEFVVEARLRALAGVDLHPCGLAELPRGRAGRSTRSASRRQWFEANDSWIFRRSTGIAWSALTPEKFKNVGVTRGRFRTARRSVFRRCG